MPILFLLTQKEMDEWVTICNFNPFLTSHLVPCLQAHKGVVEVFKDVSTWMNDPSCLVIQCGRGDHAWNQSTSIFQEFFSYVPNFIGLTNNPFAVKLRSQTCDYETHRSEHDLRTCMLVSFGSWRHEHKYWFPTEKGRFASIQKKLGIQGNPVPWTVRGDVVLYCCKSPTGYWYSGKENIQKWIQDDIHELGMIRSMCSFPIRIRYHPSTQGWEKNAHFKKLSGTIENIFRSNGSLEQDLLDVRCGVVNSGTMAVHLCQHGVPIIYRDDSCSLIPIHKIGVQGYSSILHIDTKNLPKQESFLDLIATHTVTCKEAEDGTFLRTRLLPYLQILSTRQQY